MKWRRAFAMLAAITLSLSAVQCSLHWSSIKLEAGQPQEALCAPIACSTGGVAGSGGTGGSAGSGTAPKALGTCPEHLPNICVSPVRRPVFDWSRIALRDLKNDNCVRITSPGAPGLGYVDADDSPDRDYLLLPVAGDRVEFLTNDDMGTKSTVAGALQEALDNVDELDIDLFTTSCSELCRTSRPHVRIRFDSYSEAPVIDDFGTDDPSCALMAERAGDSDGGAGGTGGRDGAARSSGGTGGVSAGTGGVSAGTGGASSGAGSAGAGGHAGGHP